MAYFDLKVMLSYRTSSYNGAIYYFKKGTPTLIPDNEADAFRNQPDIFFECNEHGGAIVYKRDNEPEARSYAKFRQYDIFGDEGNDAEDVLKKAFDQTVAEREAKPVDVAALLDAVASDTIEEPVEVEEVVEDETGTITSDDITKGDVKKKRPRKKLN